MLTLQKRRFAFLLLAVPFFLNDFGFIAFNGTYGVYAVDYAVRILVIFACFAWPISREIVLENSAQNPRVQFLLLPVVLLPIVGRILYNFTELPFVNLTGWQGLFQFGQIDNLQLYWLDLLLGLFLVALSEEIVFRKLALSWLRETDWSDLSIIIFSACFFSMMHWGSGLGRVLFTFALGVIYMMIYLKIGRLWPLVLAHWIENFFVFSQL